MIWEKTSEFLFLWGIPVFIGLLSIGIIVSILIKEIEDEIKI